MNYDEWAKEIGIFSCSESREAWEYQEKRYNEIIDEIEDMIIDSDDSPKMILHEPFRTILNKIEEIRS